MGSSVIIAAASVVRGSVYAGRAAGRESVRRLLSRLSQKLPESDARRRLIAASRDCLCMGGE